MKSDRHIVFATNDSRSNELRKALEERVLTTTVHFDPVSFLHKYIAAALSYNRKRKTWWNRYQWHPITQSGRRKRLYSQIRSSTHLDYDALLMWGSWFHPFPSNASSRKPFYLYIDQSCNSVPDQFDSEDPCLQNARALFNRSQFQTYTDCGEIFCMSQWAKRQTLASHPRLDSAKVHKVGWGPIGVDLTDEPINLPQQDPYVLFVGHEFHRKGVDLLRAAIPSVVQEVPDVRFKIVGGNSDHLTVDQHPNLDFLGIIRNKEMMKDLYRNASVFVLPHRFDRSPHVLVEAMSAGKPIVTSNQGGAVEVVQHGKNGFLVDVGDIDSLSHHLKVLLQNQDLCSSFGREGRDMMLHGYRWTIVADKMLQLMR